MGWGGGAGAPRWVAGVGVGCGLGGLVVRFPLTAGLPLVGSPSCSANRPSGLRETTPPDAPPKTMPTYLDTISPLKIEKPKKSPVLGVKKRWGGLDPPPPPPT